MARTEKVAGGGCSGGEGHVEVEVGVGVDGKGVIECRICQEEGEEDAMDSPCACTGTLKFAHRKCIQRWCNKKGNITCEICNQVYSPNYVLPPPKCCSDEMDMDLRQNWVGRIDTHDDSHFLAIAIAEQQLLQAEFEDCVSASSSGVTCCRTIALILMFLLLVRHVIVIVRDVSMLQDATVLFSGIKSFHYFRQLFSLQDSFFPVM
ncbi:uncharacterized protein LOC120672438 isoform X3 [Panicum virgatum]|uniref:uncharacterized protein LOC120672438 isoform X3 n=1 Tax=Panicum virgatum TaxID=38727 RepID=UPI0019D65BFB|nr:uncharacterized protein LOC120672438 isoform X3 [Panicum virgatum]